MHIKTVEKLDKISGFVFFCANVSFKFKNIPFLAYILNISALAFYSLGYLLWFIVALLYPGYKRDEKKWYGFISYKWQYILAASLGGLATLFWIIAPNLFVVAAWVYVVSQVFWLVSELQKRDKPHPEATQYSVAYYTDYIKYILTLTLSSLWVAINATMAFAMPAAIFHVAMPYLTIFTILFAAIVSYYWCCITFGAYPAPELIKAVQIARLDSGLARSPSLVDTPISNTSSNVFVDTPIPTTGTMDSRNSGYEHWKFFRPISHNRCDSPHDESETSINMTKIGK